MLIGKLAARSGFNIETIRYYERQGLLPRPTRGVNNYRIYSDAHVRRLRFVRRTRNMGLSLAEVKDLLSMVENNDYKCSEIKALGERHLAVIQAKIKDLRRLERAVLDLTSRCGGARNMNCGLIDAMWN